MAFEAQKARCVSFIVLFLHRVAYADIHAFGNLATNKICHRHNQSKYCWSPLHFDNKDNYTSFWLRHGRRVEPLGGGRSRGTAVYDVVHLRCGDILVTRGREYTVPTTECIDASLAWLPSPKVYLLVGGHTRKVNSTLADIRCAALTKKVVSVMQAAGKRVTLLTNGTQRDDWATLFGARYVLALISSSFVFTAKITSLSNLKMMSAAVTSAAPWWFHCDATPG